jgi:hypothetical protein
MEHAQALLYDPPGMQKNEKPEGRPGHIHYPLY